VTKEHGIYHGKYFTTLIFASMFLFSLGIFSHSVFADTIVNTISVPTCSCGIGYGPYGIGINQNTNSVYLDVSGGFAGRNGAVYVINDTTDTITGKIATNGGPGDVAVNPNTNKIYVADEGFYSTRPQFYPNHIVFVINGSTNNLISTITVGTGPYGIAVNPNTNKIYVANLDSNTVSVIDGLTDAVTNTITVGTKPTSIGVNPNTNKIYVANLDSNTVSVIDGSTDAVTSTITGFSGPGGIAVNPNTNKIYVANSENGVLLDIDGATNNITNSIFVGNGSSEIRINPISNKIYAEVDGAYESGGTVSVVDGSTDTFMQAIQVPTGPRGIDINPILNKIYVSSYNDKAVSVIDGSSSSTSPEPIAPSTPQNLTATLVIAPDNYNYLTWSAPSTDGGSQITNYKIYRSTTAGAETLFTVGSNDQTFTDYHPANNQTYYYRVSAVTSFGESQLSNEVSVRGPSPPHPPTELTATTESFTQINLSWNAPLDNGGHPITNYDIYRGTMSGVDFFVTQIGNFTSYNDAGLTGGQTYYYVVKAVNSNGEISGQSNEASATTVAPSPGASIVLNNVKQTSGDTDSSNHMTISNFNAGSGSNQLLAVGISATKNNVASVTFNGTPLTQAISSFTNYDAEFWYLKNPSGIGNIVVTFNGQPLTETVVGAYSFSGVDQINPIDNTAANHSTASSSPSISITATYANDWILDLPSIRGGAELFNPTCTEQWDVDVVGFVNGASSSTIAYSPGTVSCGWTANNGGDMWDDIAIELKASGTSEPPGTPGAPTSLVANTVSSSTIDLNWNAPTNNGGSPVTAYMIERSTDNGNTWSTLVANTGTTSTTYSDTGLSSDTTYTYRVSAINSVGAGSSSNVASATTLAILTVNAVDILGNPINGIWMELHSANGDTIATGYTPIKFDVKQGTQYMVYASNYLHYVFLHWDDGSLNNHRDITPAGNDVITATYTP